MATSLVSRRTSLVYFYLQVSQIAGTVSRNRPPPYLYHVETVIVLFLDTCPDNIMVQIYENRQWHAIEVTVVS